MSAPAAGSRRKKLHGLVIIEDGAVRFAMVVKLAKCNCQATVCSDINAAVKLMRERMKEIDIVVVSDALSRLKPAIMNLLLLCKEAELRLAVLRKDEKKDNTWVLMSYSRMEEELESIRRSTMNRDDSHAYRLPVAAASPHCDINGLTTTTVAMGMVAIASPVNRATNPRKARRETTAPNQVINTQTRGQDVPEQSAQHQQKKTRLVWTKELHKKFEEAYKKLSLTGDVVPKKILTLMKPMINPMDGVVLTRGNISSHLQKYREKQTDQHVHVNASANPILTQRQQMSSVTQQQWIMHPKDLHTQLAYDCEDQIWPRSNYCESASMNHQPPVQILSEPNCSEPSKEHHQSSQILTTYYHGHNENDGVNAYIHQRQPMAHRVLAMLRQHAAGTTFNIQNSLPEHEIQASGDMSAAQASWREAMTIDAHSSTWF